MTVSKWLYTNGNMVEGNLSNVCQGPGYLAISITRARFGWVGPGGGGASVLDANYPPN